MSDNTSSVPSISSFDEAKTFLDKCERSELRDHYFGDREVSWHLDGVEVAFGYLGPSSQSVSIFRPVTNEMVWDCDGKEARNLSYAGKLTELSRNDTEGPDRYQGY